MFVITSPALEKFVVLMLEQVKLLDNVKLLEDTLLVINDPKNLEVFEETKLPAIETLDANNCPPPVTISLLKVIFP